MTCKNLLIPDEEILCHDTNPINLQLKKRTTDSFSIIRQVTLYQKSLEAIRDSSTVTFIKEVLFPRQQLTKVRLLKCLFLRITLLLQMLVAQKLMIFEMNLLNDFTPLMLQNSMQMNKRKSHMVKNFELRCLEIARSEWTERGKNFMRTKQLLKKLLITIHLEEEEQELH